MDSIGYALANNILDILDGLWESKSDSPISTNGQSATGQFHFYNGKIYLLKDKSMYEYDPEVNSWTLKSTSGVTHNLNGSALKDGKIYYMGSGYQSGASEVYDISTNTWQYIANLPTPMYMNPCEVIGDKIFSLGGQTTTSKFNVQTYNISNNSWDIAGTYPNIPSGYDGFGCGRSVLLSETEIALVASLTSANRNIKVLNVNNKTWSDKAPTQQQYGEIGVVKIRNHLYCTPGRLSAASVEKYDIKSNTWGYAPNMLISGTYFEKVCADSTRMFVFGAGSPNTNKVQIYDIKRQELKNLLSWLATK